MATGEPQHIPVMLERVVEILEPALEVTDPVLVDGTLGLGGHTAYLLERFPTLRIIGVDRDSEALRIAQERLGPLAERVNFVHARCDEVEKYLSDHDTIHGFLLDLGVSSMQLDKATRGFSYSQDAPLDMRMDGTASFTAQDILDTYSVEELTRVLDSYGEERYAYKIASAIVRRRAQSPVNSSRQLVQLIDEVLPWKAKKNGGHPAKRTFQALRVEVNDELGSLRSVLPKALRALGVGGHLVVLAYQSLEDRIVKEELSRVTSSRTPLGLPVELPGYAAEFKLLTRGAERAGQTEMSNNSRATSVRLRAVARVLAPAGNQ